MNFASLAVALAVAAEPQPEISTIVVPIRVSLAPLSASVEEQVPKSFVQLDRFELDPQKRFGVRYRVTRDRVALQMLGSGLHATTTLDYAIEACGRTWNPLSKSHSMFPCVSCGFGEPPRQARVALHSRIDWHPQWYLQTRTRARPADFPNRCGVTILSIDVTNRTIAPFVDAQMRTLAKTIDANAPKFTSIRATAQQIWTSLQAPSEVASRSWLLLEPLDLALTPLRGSGAVVTSTLTLRARTHLLVGDRPQRALQPLPPLRVAEAPARGLRVPLEITLPYAEATRVMTAEVANKPYKLQGRHLLVESIAVRPGSAGRTVIEASIDYRGGAFRRYRGPVLLEGTPRFDAATSSIVIDDLDYALDRRRGGMFVRLADRLAHESVRASLTTHARWPLAAQLAAARRDVERALNRPLARGTTMRGRVEAIAPQSVTASNAALLLRVLATGEIEVEVRDWR